MRTILVTGGAGFIGSHFLIHAVKNYPDSLFINLDSLSYASNLALLNEVNQEDNYLFVRGDICDQKLLNALFSKYRINGVIHFAAQTHVDNSIVDPAPFIETNINGTFALLQAAKSTWMTKSGFENARFHHISTDEVYGSLSKEGSFFEESPLAPNNPYSASKAASDMLVKSYYKTYGLNCVITHCSNNFGPGQHEEKLIPTIVRKAMKQEPIPLYGDGSHIRDWLFVKDHCHAIDLVFHKGVSGETYNIGGQDECSNLFLAKKICHLLDQLSPKEDGSSYQSQIAFVADRPGHDWRYSIDSSKLKNSLNWRPKTLFSHALEQTVHWYYHHYLNTLELELCN